MTAPWWFADAACRGKGATMFPVDDRMRYGPRADKEYNPARAVCDTCPHTGVDGPCLAWALKHHEWHGCWAGTSPADRTVIARRAKKGAA
jgi:hypothetical protein